MGFFFGWTQKKTGQHHTFHCFWNNFASRHSQTKIKIGRIKCLSRRIHPSQPLGHQLRIRARNWIHRSSGHIHPYKSRSSSPPPIGFQIYWLLDLLFKYLGCSTHVKVSSCCICVLVRHQLEQQPLQQ